MRIACLTGGGDAVGLNAAIAALVRRLTQAKIEVIGILGGWLGLVTGRPLFRYLDISGVDDIVFSGGTIIYTSRENPLEDKEKMENVVVALEKFGGLVVMGGDDTLKVAKTLHERKQKVIGVPKTMDLDLSGTQYSLGFWSYVESVAETLHGFITNCKSHRRIGVCEVFGRHSGFTAAAIGIAVDADFIVIPEQELDLGLMTETLGSAFHRKQYALAVVAEGINLDTGSKGQFDPHNNELLFQRGIGNFIVHHIEKTTGIESRSFQASHPHRGTPFAYDTIIGYRFGKKAAEMVINGEWGQMVTITKGDAFSGEIGSLPIAAFEPRRLVAVDSDIYQVVAMRNRCEI